MLIWYKNFHLCSNKNKSKLEKKISKNIDKEPLFYQIMLLKFEKFRNIYHSIMKHFHKRIYLNTSDCVNILYNKTKMYEKFDTLLKEVDEEYRTTIINFVKYKLVMFKITKLWRWNKLKEIKSFYTCIST